MYADYFTERCLSSDDDPKKDEELPEGLGLPDPDDSVSRHDSDSSLLRNTHNFEDIFENNYDNIVSVDDVVIKIEGRWGDQEVVDESDDGQNLVIIEICIVSVVVQ